MKRLLSAGNVVGFWLLVLGLASLRLALRIEGAEAKLELCQTIPLPGVEGRFDHFAVESAGQRLFLAALGNNSLEIIGLREGRRLQNISGVKRPTGVTYLPRSNQISVSSSGDGTLRLFDGRTYQPKEVIRALDDADNQRYDPESNLIYIGYGKGALGIVDASEGQLVGRIKLKGHPESFQLERPGHRLFVNVPDAKHVAVIDREQRQVIGAFPLEHFEANFPMALDQPNHRLVIGCRRPAKLVVLDSQSGKILADLPIAGDTDDLFYDAKRKRIYASCGEGFLEVIEQIDPDHYRNLQKLPTAPGARTSFFSPELDLLALAVPQRGNQAAELRVYQPK